jgi:hypothetical protein
LLAENFLTERLPAHVAAQLDAQLTVSSLRNWLNSRDQATG